MPDVVLYTMSIFAESAGVEKRREEGVNGARSNPRRGVYDVRAEVVYAGMSEVRREKEYVDVPRKRGLGGPSPYGGCNDEEACAPTTRSLQPVVVQCA